MMRLSHKMCARGAFAALMLLAWGGAQAETLKEALAAAYLYNPT